MSEESEQDAEPDERAGGSRRLTEAAHWDSEQRFRSAFESAAIGFAIVELDGRIRSVNRSLCEMLGYSGADLRRLTFVDITHPDDLPPVGPLQERLLAGAIGNFRLEQRFLHQGGQSIWGLLTVALVRDARGAPQYLLSQLVDITARKEAEQALARHADELTRSNAELEEFAYVASHDLHEPLRTVASFTQLLAERYQAQLDERGDRWLGHVLTGVGRMQRLIDDLLELARVRTDGRAFMSVDTALVVASVWQGLQLEYSVPVGSLRVGSLPTIAADATQIEQLFQNLLENAVKYRRADLVLAVDVSAERLGDGAGAIWEFAVRDNGIGLDMADAPRIFQIFQRLHREEEYAGTGIGLAICKRIVERHGGRLWVDSVPGLGATFRFTLLERAA